MLSKSNRAGFCLIAELLTLLRVTRDVESVTLGVFLDEDPFMAISSSTLVGEFLGVIFLKGLRTEKKPPSNSLSVVSLLTTIDDGVAPGT